MKQVINAAGLQCVCSRYPNNLNICYILYPMDWLDDWIENAVQLYKTSIVVVKGMDWDNDLTPWPAVGEPPGEPDFKGLASTFLDTLLHKVQPTVEEAMGFEKVLVRNLIGVSLSGLFTLWEWMFSDNYTSIGSMSGSFWYDGFLSWFHSQKISTKTGKAFFLLGSDEPKSPVEAFRSVGTNTINIVKTLKTEGINTEFVWVPGNHFSDPMGRLDRTMQALYLES